MQLVKRGLIVCSKLHRDQSILIRRKQSKLLQELGKNFNTEYKDQLVLLTVRHGDGELIDKLTAGMKVLMEQVNPPTVRRLLQRN